MRSSPQEDSKCCWPASVERSIYVHDENYAKLSKEHSQVLADQEKLRSEVTALVSDNEKLKQSVDARESQILVLRPYRTDFTRHHAKEDFEKLVARIDDWVMNRIEKFLVDEKFAEQWLNWLPYFPQVAAGFHQALDSYHDLSSSIGYPDIDQDILSAYILRFVWQGADIQYRELVGEIERTMTSCANPSLDMSAVHSWRAQTYHALFSRPEYSNIRQERIDDLASELVQVLGFVSHDSDMATFVRSISSEIIEPCISLCEKILRSHEEFYIETINPGTIMSQDRPEELHQRLQDDDINCRNVAECCSIFMTNKLKPIPTKEKLEKHLHILCSIRPALKAREFQNSTGQEAQTIVKETVLILWDPDGLQDPTELKSETWLSRVYKHSMMQQK
ncbi:hypothetical protein GQX73_g3190 [Xylaria multiplex]|uniref:Uncharacterized protein n=1 Tax=Xylaria multiplex TaxID=323545 RepID=A0A7C8N7N5_9PEZI|nr:hypothetical protein GQX73_g3190 [Xylaria multiplex]